MSQTITQADRVQWRGLAEAAIGLPRASVNGPALAPIILLLLDALDAAESVKIVEIAAAIGAELLTQDNRCTDQPIFIVERRDRIYGMDTSWGGDTCLIDDEGNELSAKDIKEYRTEHADEVRKFAAEEGYNLDDEDLMREFLTQTVKGCSRFNITHTGYVDRWMFVSAFFTEKAAEEYLRVNGHNITHSRIYVEGSFRNEEWRSLRAAFIEIAKQRQSAPDTGAT